VKHVINQDFHYLLTWGNKFGHLS